MSESAATAAPSGSASTSSAPEIKTSASGIPQAPFIADVAAYLGSATEDVAPHLTKFQETMSKYKLMEADRYQRRKALEEKIPDIRKTLDMVRVLKENKENGETLKTHFELNDTLYAQASIPPVEEVHLWLGANVMLAYPLDEAEELLSTRLKGSHKSLEGIKEDLDFLRDQITTLEVNTARLHNFDVKRRRDLRLQSEKEGEEEA